MNLSIEIARALTTSMNLSTNTKLEIYYDELFGNPTAKFAQIVFLTLTYLIGPILLSGIIAYEKYGGDPQKRNIINRLQSLGVASIIMGSIIHGTVFILRELFGLIDFDVMIWIECLFCMFCCNALLFFAEMSVFHLLYIVVWKRVKVINDEFWACFLSTSTSLISFWVVLVDHIPHRMFIPSLMLLTANAKESFEEIRYWYSITKRLISKYSVINIEIK